MTRIMSLFAFTCLAALQLSNAVLYSVTVYANGYPDGFEQKVHDNARAIMAPLLDARTDYSFVDVGEPVSYSVDGGGRFLRSAERKLPPQCPNCSKPRNWALCIALGCSCSCGGRLLVASTSSDALSPNEVQKTRVNMTQLVNRYCEKTPGCAVDVVITKLA